MRVKCPNCFHEFQTNSISRRAVKCPYCKRKFGKYRNSVNTITLNDF